MISPLLKSYYQSGCLNEMRLKTFCSKFVSLIYRKRMEWIETLMVHMRNSGIHT